MSSEAELDPIANELLDYLLQLPTETYLENPQNFRDAFYQVDDIVNDQHRKDGHNEKNEDEKVVVARKKAIRIQPTVKAKRGRPRKPTLSRKSEKKRRQVCI